MSQGQAINLAQKLASFDDHWSPKIIAEVNDVEVRLAKIQGEFVWHQHPEADELFLVLQGQLLLRFRDHQVTLGPGELYVVPRGVEHLPVAEEEVHLLLVEPKGTLNTGDTVNERTVSELQRI